MDPASVVKDDRIGKELNMSLPNMPPFQWVEQHAIVEMDSGEAVAVLAFGAYNAMGLIGPEMGGVAVCMEKPERFVIATKTIAYDMRKRREFFNMLKTDFENMTDVPPRTLNEN